MSVYEVRIESGGYCEVVTVSAKNQPDAISIAFEVFSRSASERMCENAEVTGISKKEGCSE